MSGDLKSEFRAIARANLSNLNKQKERFRDKKINALLQKIIKSEFAKSPKKPKNLLLYAPLYLEVDIFPLIFALKKQKNIKIFLPFVLRNGAEANQNFKIVPFRLPLAKNKFNIFESKNSNFVYFDKIDIAIVPILGVDCAFRRIGFGKGMFDRFFGRFLCNSWQKSNIKKMPRIIFVSRILHFSNAKISENYDIKGDYLVATRGSKYDFHSSWVKRGNFLRPFILSRAKIIHKRRESCHRTSANQSKCD